MHARTQALLLPWGCWQKYCGPGAPREVADGANNTTCKIALVSHLVRPSNAYADIMSDAGMSDAGMWDMGKSESFLWFYMMLSRSLQAEGGMPVMVALTPCSDLDILVDPILPRCRCVRVEEDHGRSSTRRCQVRFLPIINGGKGVVHRHRCLCWPRWRKETCGRTTTEGLSQDKPKGSNEPSANGQILGHDRQAPTDRSYKVRKRKHWSSVLVPSRMVVRRT